VRAGRAARFAEGVAVHRVRPDWRKASRKMAGRGAAPFVRFRADACFLIPAPPGGGRVGAVERGIACDRDWRRDV